MYKLRTQISFEAAHRLYDVATYSEECRDNLHGHSYKVNIEIQASDLNEAGMVADFKLVKQLLKNEIESEYDHSCIIRECDPLKDAIVANCKKVHVVTGNPTAEWMAEQFYLQIKSALASNGLNAIKVSRVEVQETENNIAIWEPDIKLAAEEACYERALPDGSYHRTVKRIPVVEVSD